MSTIPKIEGNNEQNFQYSQHIFSVGMKQKQKITWELSIIPNNKPILKTDQKHLPFEELFFQNTHTHTHTHTHTRKNKQTSFSIGLVIRGGDF